MTDPYHVLGVSQDASDEEIKKVLEEIIYKKPQAHHFEDKPSDSKMYTIGG